MQSPVMIVVGTVVIACAYHNHTCCSLPLNDGNGFELESEHKSEWQTTQLERFLSGISLLLSRDI